MNPLRILFFLMLILTLVCAPAHAQSINVEKGREFTPHVLSLPYAFYNESYGAAAGYVYGVTGYPQPQAMVVGTVIAGTNDAFSFFALGNNLRIPRSERWFCDPLVYAGSFGEQKSFTPGNPAFPNERAGSNGSDDDNYIEGSGIDNIAQVRFKYLLPVGAAKHEAINTYVLDRGILHSGATGGKSWNPLESGKSYLEFKPYHRRQRVNFENGKTVQETNGMEFSLYHDNTDMPVNPSLGHSARVKYSIDPGWLNSTTEYDTVELEAAKYFSLGATKSLRQQVLAFDFWTIDSPSWNDSDIEDGRTVYHRPPAYRGGALGGLWRMRAYPGNRFNDRAAIYYAAEYRVIPDWNPVADMPSVQKVLGLAWLQFAVFGELGRVAPGWSADTLHQDMKWDLGAGIRAMVKGLIVRIDMAGAPEGYGVQMMISQPFFF